MTVESVINQKMRNLSELDQMIASYVVKNMEKVVNQSIAELSKEIPVSKSSVLRFVQKLGFDGFSEFKFSIKQELNKQSPTNLNSIFELQESDIKRTQHLFKTTDFSEVVGKIFSAQRIYCYGTGYSQQTIIKEWSKQMMFLGKWTTHLRSKTEFDVVLPMINEEDLVILVSLSGETQEVKENISKLKLRKIPMLAITRVGDNFFSKMADDVMNYYSTPFYVGGVDTAVYSFVSLSLLMDSLFRKCGEYYDNHSK